MSDTTIRGNATRRGPDAKRFAFFMPEPPRQLLKIFTCYLWGTHASRTKRATVRYPLLPSLSPSLAHTLFHLSRKPLFRPFSSSTTSLFLFCGMACSVVAPFLSSSPSLTHLLHPLTNPPRKLPATSREFYKTFHASLTASVSFSQTKQRMLVWIEFLMEPTPSGPRPIPFNLPIHLSPSRLRFSATLVHLVRTA